MDTVHELLIAQTLEELTAALKDDQTTLPDVWEWCSWEGLLEDD